MIERPLRIVPPARDENAGSALLPIFLIVVAVAAVLRFWNLGSAGISSAAGGVCTAAAVYPDPSVPRLVPWMFRALFAVWAPSDTLAIAAIGFLGVATVIAVFLAGRRWVGDGPALVGAAALSGMELHLIFSRQPRSEVAFTFLVLLSVWAFLGAIERRSAVLAGAAVLAAGSALLAFLPADLRAPRASAFADAARSLLEWTSPFVLASAILGILVMLSRRARTDLVLLAWIALFLLALSFLPLDPGNLIPVLPALALAAGIGLEVLVRRFFPAWTRGRPAVLGVAVLAAGVWPSLPVLGLEDHGYELAARFLDQGRRDPRPDILVTESAVRFYLETTGGSHPLIEAEDPRAIRALEEGAFRYLVGDVRLLKSPAFGAFLAERGSDLKQVATIGNRLPEPTIVAAAGFAALDALRDSSGPPEDRASLTTIRVWRSARSGAR